MRPMQYERNEGVCAHLSATSGVRDENWLLFAVTYYFSFAYEFFQINTNTIVVGAIRIEDAVERKVKMCSSVTSSKFSRKAQIACGTTALTSFSFILLVLKSKKMKQK